MVAQGQTVDDIAVEYAESFVNGNRGSICDSLATEHTVTEAIAIAAKMVVGLPPGTASDFIYLLGIRAVEN